MKILIQVFVCFLIVFLLSCASEEGKVAPRNPNGDSELALLMRDMFDETLAMKAKIEEGRELGEIEYFRKMTTVEATEPEKAASEAYAIFTEAYHANLEELESANIGEMHKPYNQVVQACMNCHQMLCPGPMVRIEKLWLTPN